MTALVITAVTAGLTGFVAGSLVRRSVIRTLRRVLRSVRRARNEHGAWSLRFTFDALDEERRRKARRAER